MVSLYKKTNYYQSLPNSCILNGWILILIVLDKTNKLFGHSLPSYYALDVIALLYRYYANTV